MVGRPYDRHGDEGVSYRVLADHARAVAFLLSEEAQYINGQNLCVDGGFEASIMGHIPGLPRSGD